MCNILRFFHFELDNKKTPNQILDRGFVISCFELTYLNFFLRPISPTRPEPKRSMDAGSGTTLL